MLIEKYSSELEARRKLRDFEHMVYGCEHHAKGISFTRFPAPFSLFSNIIEAESLDESDISNTFDLLRQAEEWLNNG